jgi:thymidylate synthase (FAD)
MKVTLTRVTEDPILAIEEAASNCYDSEPSSDGKIMAHCIKSGHTSVTEFCNFTFHIEGVSRALLAQLTRHRHAGYAVQSQRYVKKDTPAYIIPSSIADIPEAKEDYCKLMESIWDKYNKFLSLGVEAEDARYVLPNACDTVIEVTMNLRAVMNFMNERLCTCAQWEIRQLAKMMRKLIIEQFPQLEPYLVPKCEKYGKDKAFCNESRKRSCKKHPFLDDIMKDYHSLQAFLNS